LGPSVIISGSAPVPYNSVWVLMPSMLGGGEVIAQALVAGMRGTAASEVSGVGLGVREEVWGGTTAWVEVADVEACGGVMVVRGGEGTGTGLDSGARAEDVAGMDVTPEVVAGCK
jgi:hypothetical protein